MRLFRLFSILAFLAICGTARAQNLTGQLTAQGTTCGVAATQSLTLAVSNGVPVNFASFTLSGTWSGTITFYISANQGATWSTVSVSPSGGGANVTTATGNGTWTTPNQAYTNFCAMATIFTSGTIVANIQLSSSGGSGGGGGSGSGTVTSVATSSPLTGGTFTTSGTIACGTCGVTGNPLSQFASTTSAQLAGVLSDATGTGAAVFGTAPGLSSPALTGAPTVNTFGSLCEPGDVQSVCMKDEFIANGPATLANGSFGDLRWQCTTIGSASTFTGLTGAFPNLGIAQWTTAAGQGDGSACQQNSGPAQNVFANFGALGSNVPWDSEFIVKMNATSNTRMRIGWMNALTTCYTTNVTSISATCDGFWVRYDTNIGNGAVNVGNNGITRASGVVTVTVAAHGLSLVGQSVTIAGATGCTTSPNGTFPITSIPSTTTYTFNQAGTNETCGGNAPATSTPVADTDYVFETKSGAGTPVATAVDTGVAGVTSFVRARIQSSAGGTIIFSLYGPTGTLLAGPTSISTNVATTNMVPDFHFVSDTSGTKIIDVDYWSFVATGLAR